MVQGSALTFPRPPPHWCFRIFTVVYCPGTVVSCSYKVSEVRKDLCRHLGRVLLTFFFNFENSNCKSSLFDLELTLGFYRVPVRDLKRFVFSPCKKRNVELIRLIWYVKLHENHCQKVISTLLGYSCMGMLLIHVPQIILNA